MGAFCLPWRAGRPPPDCGRLRETVQPKRAAVGDCRCEYSMRWDWVCCLCRLSFWVGRGMAWVRRDASVKEWHGLAGLNHYPRSHGALGPEPEVGAFGGPPWRAPARKSFTSTMERLPCSRFGLEMWSVWLRTIGPRGDGGGLREDGGSTIRICSGRIAPPWRGGPSWGDGRQT